MLSVVIPAGEQFNEQTNEFINIKAQALQLEHSLVSISKWESKWCKPFLSKEKKTIEESIDYIRCMTLTQNVDFLHYIFITDDIIQQVRCYIEAPMTATIISKNNKPPNREIITSELIYYWMVALNIPFECQKWHLNRLLMLINICNINNDSSKKMSRTELNNRNRALNAARRVQHNTAG